MPAARFTQLVSGTLSDWRPTRSVSFQITERFLDGTQELLGETLPSATEVVAKLPGETAGGVAEAAEEVGAAVGNLLRGVGGATAEVVRLPVSTAEDVLVTAAIPLVGVKKILWDTPKSLVNEGPWAATKNFFNGLVWQPLRTVGNAVKTVVNAGVGVARTPFRVGGELLGVGMTEEGVGATGKGLLGALQNVTNGAKHIFEGIGKSTLGKKLGSLFGGPDRWRWPTSITGEGNTTFPGVGRTAESPAEDVAEELAEAA